MTSRTLLAAAALVMAVPPPVSGQEGAGPEDVARAFHAALATGDSLTALELLAEDVIIYEAGGVEASREEYRTHHLPADIAFASAVERQASVEQSGRAGNVAWVLSRSSTSGIYREQEIHSVGTETMLLELTAEGWQIRHIHWSSRRAAPDR